MHPKINLETLVSDARRELDRRQQLKVDRDLASQKKELLECTHTPRVVDLPMYVARIAEEYRKIKREGGESGQSKEVYVKNKGPERWR